MTNKNSGSRKQRATAQRGTKIPKNAQTGPKRISRHERDLQRQKRLKIGVGIAVASALAILLSFGVYNYIVKPRQVLATVQGSNIRREDYWKYRSFVLYNQAAQYQQYSSLVNDPSQQQQYLSMAQQAQADLQSVWGSKSVDDQTLQQMIDDKVYLQSLDEFGITITDEDVRLWTDNQFAPSDAPLIPPTPTPTFVPERAAWATQTAEAMIVSPTAEAASPEAGSGSPQASPIGEAAASPQASPIGSPEASSGASPAASPIASPEASPTQAISPTPNPDQAMQTAQAGFDSYSDSVLDQAHMSRSDYYRLIARPQVARERVRDSLTADIGQTADQVHAEHILVATEELANQIFQDVTTGGQNFEDVAREKSTDTSTAPNGGDLGWFTRGVMVSAFEDAAFSTGSGQIHAPVQTQFGWHIIKVLESQSNRALTDEQISQLQDSTVNKWLDQRKTDLKVESAVDPTPTPATQTFVPPVDAPLPPTATLEASPQASPVAVGASSPVASPVSETGATPMSDATPLPAASPIVSTAATPVAAAPSPVAATPGVIQATPVVVSEVASPEASPVAASPIASPNATPVFNPLGTPTAP
jgi:parvulin-like peptidyl-prolyl isomerase